MMEAAHEPIATREFRNLPEIAFTNRPDVHEVGGGGSRRSKPKPKVLIDSYESRPRNDDSIGFRETTPRQRPRSFGPDRVADTPLIPPPGPRYDVDRKRDLEGYMRYHPRQLAIDDTDSDSKDVSFRLEIDLTEDLEPALEEFSRLNRMGNFRAAQSFFKDRLEMHLGNPYVSVQYAQMLMEMGDYKSKLKYPSLPEEKELAIIQTNWNFVDMYIGLRTKGSFQLKEDVLRYGLPRGIESLDRGNLGSTEYKTLSLFFRMEPYFEVLYIDPDWELIYENLLRQDRVWDFKDILIGAFCCYGEEKVCRKMFGEECTPWMHFPSRLLRDWLPAVYNESIALALLDILTNMAIDGLYKRAVTKSSIAYAENALDAGAELVSAIIRHSPGSLKSRQYVRWILAKIAAANYPIMYDALTSVTPGPGFVFSVTDRGDFPSTIYVPVASETPSWGPYSTKFAAEEMILMVLKVSRQLEDYQTESLSEWPTSQLI